MTNKKKTPGCVGAQSEAGQENGLSGVFPCVNSTTDGAARQPHGHVFSFLLEGEEHAVPGPALAKMLNIPPRRLRRMVDNERERGAPILASDSGYFRPADGPAGVAEVRRFLRRQDARCAANRRTTAPLRRLLKTLERGPLDGQESLFVVDEGGDGDG